MKRRTPGPHRQRFRGRPRRRPGYHARVWVLGVFVVSVFGLLLGRLGQVQVVERASYVRAAASVNTRTVIQPAVRGRILDAEGAPLVANTSSLSVTVERRALVDAQDGGRGLIDHVAAALGSPAEPLWDKTFLCGSPAAPAPPACFNGSAYQPVPILTGVDPQRALTLMEQPESFPGVGVVASATRTFPAPHSVNAAHLLGYVDRASADDVAHGNGAVAATETVGRAGLEAQYDEALRGTHGTTTVAIDPRGIVTGRLADTAPVAGRDVVTHISGPVQASAEKALSDAVTKAHGAGYAADSGAAVVLDVRTGAVVAAASYIRPEDLDRRHQPDRPRCPQQPGRRDPSPLPGDRRRHAPGVDVQGRLAPGGRRDGRGPGWVLRLHERRPGRRPGVSQLRVQGSWPADPQAQS